MLKNNFFLGTFKGKIFFFSSYHLGAFIFFSFLFFFYPNLLAPKYSNPNSEIRNPKSLLTAHKIGNLGSK